MEWMSFSPEDVSTSRFSLEHLETLLTVADAVLTTHERLLFTLLDLGESGDPPEQCGDQ